MMGVGWTAGPTPIVSDVEMSVDSGERVALVGPSGAGKTTILRLLAGQLIPSSGTVEISGRSPSRLEPRHRSELVGLVPQGLGLIPRLTVRNNLHAGLAGKLGAWRTLMALMLPVEASGVKETAVRLDIDRLLDRRLELVSGGERQRVAVGRLALQAPLVALADEPVASVDPALAEEVIDLLISASPTGTLVASLHSPDLATRRFDRVVGVAGGRIVFDLDAAVVDETTLSELYRRKET